jgi:hypothetical protein
VLQKKYDDVIKLISFFYLKIKTKLFSLNRKNIATFVSYL